jgi:lipopolysaccharide export system permease protein
MGQTIFLLIFFVVVLFERINTVIVNNASLYLLFTYLLYATAPFFTQSLPFANLLAALITLGILSRNKEIVAMEANGISMYRIILPLSVLATVSTMLIFFLNDTIVPYSVRKSHDIWSVKIKKEEERAAFKLNKIWYHGEDSIYNIRLLEPKNNILKGVTIYRFDKNFTLHQRIDAYEARWKDNGWNFYKVAIRDFSPGSELQTKTYEEKNIPIPEKPEDFKKGIKSPEEMNYKELKGYVEKLRSEGYDATRYVVDLHAKVAFPFLSVVMVLIGGPIGMLVGRGRGGNIAKGVGVSSLIGFIYWLVFAISTTMGHAGTLPAPIAAWAPNVFFGLAGWFILESIHQ